MRYAVPASGGKRPASLTLGVTAAGLFLRFLSVGRTAPGSSGQKVRAIAVASQSTSSGDWRSLDNAQRPCATLPPCRYSTEIILSLSTVVGQEANIASCLEAPNKRSRTLTVMPDVRVELILRLGLLPDDPSWGRAEKEVALRRIWTSVSCAPSRAMLISRSRQDPLSLENNALIQSSSLISANTQACPPTRSTLLSALHTEATNSSGSS